MRVITAISAFLAVAYGSTLEARQQGENCQIFWSPDHCENHGLVLCDGSGGLRVCCTRCY
ncbi:hypothetical protein BDW62DRAFT_177439 [Aspergillus aurantiobrunneus]